VRPPEKNLLLLLSKAFLNTRDKYPAQSVLFARAMLVMIEGSPKGGAPRGAGFHPLITF
jgi:hypothetical protein